MGVTACHSNHLVGGEGADDHGHRFAESRAVIPFKPRLVPFTIKDFKSKAPKQIIPACRQILPHGGDSLLILPMATPITSGAMAGTYVPKVRKKFMNPPESLPSKNQNPTCPLH